MTTISTPQYTLYNGDCRDFMRGMEAGSVVTVTDPPYGIGAASNDFAPRGAAKPIIYDGAGDWDSEPVSPETIAEVLRVSRDAVIFGGNYYALPPSSGWIVWDKLNSGDFSQCELAWTSYNRGIRKFLYMWNGMIKQKPEKRYHPTQKPLDLMLWVVANYTAPGDIVADWFMGSGTTGEACRILGRKFIGVEREAKYFEIAKRRIENAAAQPLLLPPQLEKAEQPTLPIAQRGERA